MTRVLLAVVSFVLLLLVRVRVVLTRDLLFLETVERSPFLTVEKSGMQMRARATQRDLC